MRIPRKILFLPRWYPTEEDVQNGIFIQKHARAAALNNEVVVLFSSPTSGQTRTTKSIHGNLTEIIICYKKTPFAFWNFLNYLIATFSGWKTIKDSGFKPDICHVNMLARSALLALWLKWKFAIPFVLSEHWSGYITGKFQRQTWLKKWFVLYASRKAALITAVSEFQQAAMIRNGINGKNKVLPNVVEVLADVLKEQSVKGTFRYLVVADLKDEIKNISGIIRAFVEVNKKDAQTELIIVGDGEDRKQMESLPGIPSVQFLGEKSNEEALKIIPTAHVLIVNSRVESFSVVTLESIFSGRPVIATRCGGPEQFINSQNGILIEKDNDQQLAEAMLRMKENYSQYPPEKVMQSIPDNYSLKSISILMNKYYDEVLDGTLIKVEQ